MGLTALHLVNRALIIPDENKDTSGGYALNTSYNPHHHFAVTGIVDHAPDKLICDFKRYKELLNPKSEREELERGDISKRGLPFMPHSIEIQKGDKVLFRYEGQINRADTEVDESKILMPYTNIMAILDENNNPTPINGNVFIEPFLNSDCMGYVRFLSKYPNKGYITDNSYTEVEGLEIGQRVIFKKGFFHILSHELHPSVNFDGRIVCVQRRDILGVI